MNGGNIINSLGTQIIRKLNNKKYKICESKYINQINKKKIILNNDDIKQTAGTLFIGSTTKDPNNIRILVGLDTNNKISSFGGKCNSGENKFKCALRETIEELFTLKVDDIDLNEIIDFLNKDPLSNYAYVELGNKNVYLMDISILGDIIHILYNQNHIKLPIYNYLSKYIKTPKINASVDYDNNPNTGIEYTFDILNYMKDFDDYHDNHVKYASNKYKREIEYLSFPKLYNLYHTMTKNENYALLNSKTNTRHSYPFRGMFINLIKELVKENNDLFSIFI